ncbi:MAG TPA: serine/threonine-protein kinase, partial [Chloroflexota bacterium]|nr:serine/threonine-protein kinase [Chloroflexota bacterium]
MRPEMAKGRIRDRFVQEAKAAAKVEHDHIVPIYQVGEDRGVQFLAMPLLKGESLEDRLKREHRLSVAEVLKFSREMAAGLSAAHARGLVHRDVKPANVWLEAIPPAPRFRVKILDFGLARRAGTGQLNLTHDGTIVGTPAYMSPEQACGKTVDARADLFSLGVVMYRMATGELPFKGVDPVSQMIALTTESPPDPVSLNPELPPELADLIVRLLEKDPAHRPASAKEVARQLVSLSKAGPKLAPLHPGEPAPANPWADLQDSSTDLLTPVPDERRPNRPRLAPVLVAAVMIVLIVISISIARRINWSKKTTPVAIAPTQSEPNRPATKPQPPSVKPPIRPLPDEWWLPKVIVPIGAS